VVGVEPPVLALLPPVSGAELLATVVVPPAPAPPVRVDVEDAPPLELPATALLLDDPATLDEPATLELLEAATWPPACEELAFELAAVCPPPASPDPSSEQPKVRAVVSPTKPQRTKRDRVCIFSLLRDSNPRWSGKLIRAAFRDRDVM
jgi:hypothetical protein